VTVAVVVSLLAAVCFGVASVLQHDSALRARRRTPLHPGLLADLVRRPRWLVGVGAQFTGVALHLFAVNIGPLSLVQPLLTTGLVVALLMQRIAGRRVSHRALLSASLVVVGLVVFLVEMPEQGVTTSADVEQWIPGLLLAGAVLASTLSAGLRGLGSARSVFLGASAGTVLATSAALGKAWGAVLRANGLFVLLGSWQLWAALACGLAGALLSQAAFQAGPLGGSLAAMMAIDPVIGVGLGIVVFDEPFATEATVIARCLGLLLTVVGVGLLAWTQRGDARRLDRRIPVLLADARSGGSRG